MDLMHTPRGGRSEYTDRHRDRNRESGSIREKRDNLIEQGLCQVLRKQGEVQTERDHDFPLQDHAFEIGPRHLSYLFDIRICYMKMGLFRFMR